ncbi:MAG: AAA family ATPase [Caulobacter sp.]|nr:AAA family ATPase [Caulobacter sp.]
MSFDLTAHRRGLVVAPAGCGKTQTIVDALKRGVAGVTLVLTHTNAGVSALRERLKKAGVPSGAYRLVTIDGWALRLVANFPQLSGLVVAGLPKIDYPALRKAALKAVVSGALDQPVAATYQRLIVDEYQDCCLDQHALVLALADRLPCCVLGDPLQRIFDFRPGSLPDWDTRVAVDFPVVETFAEPWRWRNAGERDFGLWILRVRDELLAGRGLDLRSAPSNVTWRQKPADANELANAQRDAVLRLKPSAGEGLLVIGDSRRPSTRSDFARKTAGLHVVEPVDLNDFMGAAAELESCRGLERLKATLRVTKEVMTGIDMTALGKRLDSLHRGTAHNSATASEAACLAMLADDGPAAAARVIEAFAREPGARIFRRQIMTAMIDALHRAASKGVSVTEAAIHVRERHRATARALPNRAVGSTLLLKGLEAEHAIILDADDMNARHLYVAISRASKSLTLFSSSNVIRPR